MKIIIFGATGKTGIELIKRSQEAGHHVTAFVRQPDKLGELSKNIIIKIGDVYDKEVVLDAMKNQDVVICALGAGQSLKKTDVRSIGTKHIIESMKNIDVDRLVVVSAMGVGESWKQLSWFNKLFFATLLKNSRKDHELQERQVKESDLSWTIVRPSALVDEEAHGKFIVGEAVKAKESKISRADLADYILSILTDEKTFKMALTITKS